MWKETDKNNVFKRVNNTNRWDQITNDKIVYTFELFKEVNNQEIILFYRPWKSYVKLTNENAQYMDPEKKYYPFALGTWLKKQQDRNNNKIKWKETNKDHIFKRVNENIWYEIYGQDEKIFAQFISLDVDYTNDVILFDSKRKCYVKLTDENAQYKDDRADYFIFNYGSWSLQ